MKKIRANRWTNISFEDEIHHPMKNIILFIGLLFLAACSPKPGHIIPVNLAKYENEIATRLKTHGLTQEEMNEINRPMNKELLDNTQGKLLPEVFVSKLTGPTVKLQDLIHEPTLVNFTSPGCGPGNEGTLDFLPKALDMLKKEKIVVHTICIIVRDSSDILKPEKITNLFHDCGKYYQEVYVMEGKDALRINAIGSPMRYFISKDFVVKSIDQGSNRPEILKVRILEQIKGK